MSYSYTQIEYIVKLHELKDQVFFKEGDTCSIIFNTTSFNGNCGLGIAYTLQSSVDVAYRGEWYPVEQYLREHVIPKIYDKIYNFLYNLEHPADFPEFKKTDINYEQRVMEPNSIYPNRSRSVSAYIISDKIEEDEGYSRLISWHQFAEYHKLPSLPVVYNANSDHQIQAWQLSTSRDDPHL